jgi:hypothetical protein
MFFLTTGGVMLTSSELLQEVFGAFPSIIEKTEADQDLLSAIEDGLRAIESGSLSWARLNQVLHLCSQAGMSEGFYSYYFLKTPSKHPCPVTLVLSSAEYRPPTESENIVAPDQLRWGILRFVYDALLYWGNVVQSYRELRQESFDTIAEFFASKRIDETHLVRRGQIVGPKPIPIDQRYLISEMACKTYEAKTNIAEVDHVSLALQAFRVLKAGGKLATWADLRAQAETLAEKSGQKSLLDLLFEEAESPISSEEEILALYSPQFEASQKVRAIALQNTRTYLSICGDLDVYVATSMRTRDDFREMARTCEEVFRDPILDRYNLRYFDPTLNAANYHEDKGIIECLMVKTCKALVYIAQHRESLGKISEYAMALSLGKPVIILCPADIKGG